MAYKLIITDRADELIDKLVGYIINKLQNKEAASHLLDELDDIYSRLADNPYQFPESKDDYLYSNGSHGHRGPCGQAGGLFIRRAEAESVDSPGACSGYGHTAS